jgi:hypothetical protein
MGRKMWTALLTIAIISLLVSSALAVAATYLYYTSEENGEVDQTGAAVIGADEEE